MFATLSSLLPSLTQLPPSVQLTWLNRIFLGQSASLSHRLSSACPGMQRYTGNHLKTNHSLKHNHTLEDKESVHSPTFPFRPQLDKTCSVNLCHVCSQRLTFTVTSPELQVLFHPLQSTCAPLYVCRVWYRKIRRNGVGDDTSMSSPCVLF